MFDLANDRLSYSELLRPDAGYTLDFAVGMTYSLDLEALLGVPVSLGLLDEADEGNLRARSMSWRRLEKVRIVSLYSVMLAESSCRIRFKAFIPYWKIAFFR